MMYKITIVDEKNNLIEFQQDWKIDGDYAEKGRSIEDRLETLEDKTGKDIF